MTTDQAVKAISSHLEVYMHSVPESLQNKIGNIINRTRTVVKKEVILANRQKKRPNLQQQWERICEIHMVDPVEAKKGRKQERISAKAHFVRYIIMNYEYVSLMDFARFFGNDHTTIIHLRDKSKVPCPIPPFYQKKRFVITQ